MSYIRFYNTSVVMIYGEGIIYKDVCVHMRWWIEDVCVCVCVCVCPWMWVVAFSLFNGVGDVVPSLALSYLVNVHACIGTSNNGMDVYCGRMHWRWLCFIIFTSDVFACRHITRWWKCFEVKLNKSTSPLNWTNCLHCIPCMIHGSP